MTKIAMMTTVVLACVLSACGGDDKQPASAPVQPPVAQSPGGPGSALSPTPTATAKKHAKKKKHKKVKPAAPETTATVDADLPTYTVTPPKPSKPIAVPRKNARATVSSSAIRVDGGALPAGRNIALTLHPSGLSGSVTVEFKSGGRTLAVANLTRKSDVLVPFKTPKSGSVTIVAGNARASIPVR